MIEITGDIWHYHEAGYPIVITTNGDLNSRGQAIMGRGIALEMKTRYPEFPQELAIHLEHYGNKVGYFKFYNVFTFPTKHHWFEKSDIELIKISALSLYVASGWAGFDKVYMVRPGCSNGKLLWRDVKPILDPILNDRFIVVQN
jgi:hypothetical protein